LVSAASEGVGHGSEFTLHLPLNGDTASQTHLAQVPESLGAQPAPDTRRRVLVVDDNRDGAESMTMLLGAHGHEVRTVHDGPTALTVAAEWRPDVMLLDIGLPGMNGYDVAERIAGQPWRGSMQLVAVTGWGQAEDRARSAKAGFDAHLVKPVELDVLLQAVAAR
jgi:CheY-like chemotaxis protein